MQTLEPIDFKNKKKLKEYIDKVVAMQNARKGVYDTDFTNRSNFERNAFNVFDVANRFKNANTQPTKDLLGFDTNQVAPNNNEAQQLYQAFYPQQPVQPAAPVQQQPNNDDFFDDVQPPRVDETLPEGIEPEEDVDVQQLPEEEKSYNYRGYEIDKIYMTPKLYNYFLLDFDESDYDELYEGFYNDEYIIVDRIRKGGNKIFKFKNSPDLNTGTYIFAITRKKTEAENEPIYLRCIRKYASKNKKLEFYIAFDVPITIKFIKLLFATEKDVELIRNNLSNEDIEGKVTLLDKFTNKELDDLALILHKQNLSLTKTDVGNMTKYERFVYEDINVAYMDYFKSLNQVLTHNKKPKLKTANRNTYSYMYYFMTLDRTTIDANLVTYANQIMKILLSNPIKKLPQKEIEEGDDSLSETSLESGGNGLTFRNNTRDKYKLKKIPNTKNYASFGKLVIDLKELMHHKLVVYKNNKLLFTSKRGVNNDFLDLIMKKYNSNRIYNNEAIRLFKKLCESAEINCKYSKKHQNMVNPPKTSIYYQNENQMIDSLYKIIGSIASGNNNNIALRNEGILLLDELLKVGGIDLSLHKSLYNKFFI